MAVSVAVAGLDRAGRQHLEQLLLRQDCAVETVWDPDAALLDHVRGLASVSPGWNALLASPAEVVFVALPVSERADRVREVLSAGKHVVIEPPIGDSVANAANLFDISQAMQRIAVVATTSRWEADVLSARTALADGTIGEPCALSLQLWQYYPPLSSTASTLADIVRTRASRPIDELLHLTGKVPIQVLARRIPPANDQSAPGLVLMAMFSEGATAHIQIHPHALAPVDTGWTITGTRGGYGGLTRYTVSEDHELIDDPQSRMGVPASTQFYDAVFRRLQDQGANPSPLREAMNVLRVLDGVERSMASGKIETVLG